MTIKIGRAAVGQKFYRDGHTYTVMAYVPAGQPHDYHNGGKGLVFSQPYYTAISQYRDREVRFSVSVYMKAAKDHLARHPLPV